MLKFILPLLILLLANFSFATPKRVGPVSYYGTLITNGNKIVGEKNNNQAMLRGVSLFWSDATGSPYYKKEVISWAAENLHIDIFRYAMGVQYYDSYGNASNPLQTNDAYITAKTGALNQIDLMVNAAIENDVYIIIDWHSHRAQNELSEANTFFATVAQKYANVPNVIYEIYNEPPQGTGWSVIKPYAETVSATIRQYTNNLIIVGNSSWDQNPQEGASSPVNQKNIAYTLHFYAGTHYLSSYSGKIESTLNAGYPVFISEWGTTSANGDGDPNSSSTKNWTDYMDQKQIPNCNWSFRQETSTVDGKSEQSAMFAGSENLVNSKSLSEASYTTSGNLVKNYLVSNARSWADSITKNTHKGSCAFAHSSAKETDGQLTGLLKSGCTYTSSDESVVSISGSNIIIKGYGYAIITGNDNSESVVQINPIPSQSLNNFMNVTCNYTQSCSSERGTSRTVDYDNDGSFEWTITAGTTTTEGATFSLKSLDPSKIEVSQKTCTSYSCSNSQKNQKVWMYTFKDFGTAKIVISAPAVTGYRAMNDTILVTYNKGENRIPGFGKKKFELGQTITDLLPDTTIFGTPVTYTFDGEETSPYLQKMGRDVIAGNQKAIVKVNAYSPETSVLAEYNVTVSFTIGDTSEVVPEAIFAQQRAIQPQIRIQGSQLQFTIQKTGLVKINVYDMLGHQVLRHSKDYIAGDHSLDISNNLSRGIYLIEVEQSNSKALLRWNKR